MSFGFGLLVTALLLAAAGGTSNFEEVRDGYLFLFHEDNGVILVTKDDNCYFVSMANLKTDSSASIPDREDEILSMLSGTTPAEVVLSSESEIYSKFQDIVADVVCHGRQLYDVTIPGECAYMNDTYAAGESWKDECGHNCRCINGPSGLHPQCADKSGLPARVCDGSSTSPPDNECRDTIDNCHQYTHTACSGAYVVWAQDHCPLFCGFCTNGVTTPPPLCEDAIPSCAYYDSEICTNPVYADWTESNCRKFCNMCDITTPTTTVWTTPESGCYDAISYCDQYGSDVCSHPEYQSWAHDNCQKFCGICTVSGEEARGSTTPGQCVDLLDTCPLYGEEACGGLYLSWAKHNCRKFCNLCEETTEAEGPVISTTTDEPVYREPVG